MIDFHNKVVWITGASSGIGEASYTYGPPSRTIGASG